MTEFIMRKPWNIVVMRGGPGAEREVSLRSGQAVAAALASRGHVVHELDPQRPDWTLPAGTQAVFLALHGIYGEDGTVQSRLEQLGVPYTGCGPEASRVAFDKVLAKERFLSHGVPTPKHVVIDSPRAPFPSEWTPPLIVKPSRQGSSVGLQFVDRVADWPAALEQAFQHDDRVLVEERILGAETTVGVLEDRALPVVGIAPRDGRNTYATKYTKGASDFTCPAELDPATTAAVQQAALAAFRALGCQDYARVDVMVRPDGSPAVLEVNTLPGMTELSLFPKAAAAVGLGYAALCERMVELALRRAPKPAVPTLDTAGGTHV